MAQTWRALVLTAILAAIAFTIGGAYVGLTPGTYGIGLSGVTSPSFHVESVPPNSSLSDTGLRAGDAVRWQRWDFHARADILEPLVGTTANLVTADGRVVRLVARPGPRQNLPLHLIVVKLSFLLVAALLLLRRWQQRAVRSLVYFLTALGIALGLANANPEISPEFSYILFFYGSAMLFVLAGASAADFSAYFSGTPDDLERWLARLAVVTAILAAVVNTPIELLVSSHNERLGAVQRLLLLAPFVFALATIICGYVTARKQERSRRLWILVIVGTGILGPLIDMAVMAMIGYQPLVDQLTLLTVAVIPVGLAYVILRHRLIDVGFVLNQAAIYAGVSIVVVGAVAIVEALISQYLTNVNHITSTSVQLVVALGLGISLNAIHKRVEHVVDRAFFRERYAAEAALQSFSFDAGFIDDPSALLERCVQEVERHAKASSAGVWLREDSGAYVLREGTLGKGVSADVNDPAIVAMRARRVVVDLDAVDSVLPGILAFPMLSSGELLGVLVCNAKRNEENYAPDERRTIAQVATSVGHAWSALRVKELERELERLRTQSTAR